MSPTALEENDLAEANQIGFISGGPNNPQTEEEKDGIFSLLSKSILEQQRIIFNAIQGYHNQSFDHAAHRNNTSFLLAQNKTTPKSRQELKTQANAFKTCIAQPGNKKALKEILERPELQQDLANKLQAQEVKNYKQLQEKLPDKTPLKWASNVTNSTTKEIRGPNGQVYCDLTKTKHSEPIKVNLSDNSYQDITDRETIDFPKKLKNGNGPFHIVIAARGNNNQPSKDIPGFSLHYNDQGKLESLSCPPLIKFAGIGPDALGYVEKNGQIYTLPVTRSKYEELNKEVAQTRGIETIAISEKNNYEVLQGNKKEVLAFANKIGESTVAPNEVNEKLIEAKKQLANGDFSNAIESLNKRKDLALGIRWHESEDLESGTKALVRDARNVTRDPDELKKDRPEKYGMQVLNEVRAAINLIDAQIDNGTGAQSDATDEAKAKLQFIAKNALEDIENLNSSKIKEYNSVIVDVLKKSDLNLDAKKLVFAMQMTNFEDTHRHIVTLSKVQDKQGADKTVIEADIMLNGMTPTLKQQFDAISTNYKGAVTNPTKAQKELQSFFDNSPDLEWYRKLPDYKKTIIAQNADKIASGKYIIPTQLLGDMPCPRNAYNKVTAISGGPNEKPEIVNENMHCGTPATKTKDKAGAQKIVSNNIELLRSFTKNGKISLLSFNQAQYLGGEKTFATQLRKEAKGNSKVKYSALPLNGFRNAPGSGEDTSYFKEYLGELGKSLVQHCESKGAKTNQGLEQIAQYLEHGGRNLDKVSTLIANSDLAPEAQKTLTVAAEARGLIDDIGSKEDRENRHLAMTNKISRLETVLKQEDHPLHGLTEPYTRIEFCKSGKDRTGYAQIKNSVYAVCQHLNIDTKDAKKDAILSAMGAGGHTQEMTGVQGGTIGCHGIKHSKILQHISSDKEALDKILNQTSADFNSGIKQPRSWLSSTIKTLSISRIDLVDPITKSKRNKAIKNFETLYEEDKQRNSVMPTKPKLATINDKTRSQAQALAKPVSSHLSTSSSHPTPTTKTTPVMKI